MNNFNVLIEIFLGLLIGSVLIFVFFKNKNFSNKPENNEKEEQKIKETLIKKIDKDTKTFQNEALRFYIRKYIDEYKFSQPIKEEIKQKFPFVYATPFFPRYNLFGKEIYIFENIIKEKIKNYKDKDLYTSLDAYEIMMLEESEKKAKKILENYKKY